MGIIFEPFVLYLRICAFQLYQTWLEQFKDFLNIDSSLNNIIKFIFELLNMSNSLMLFPSSFHLKSMNALLLHE